MKRVTVTAIPTCDEACYPTVGWDLDDSHKLSFGRDGNSDTWICYLGVYPGEDLYAEVDPDEIASFGRMLVQMVDEAKATEAERLAEVRRNVDTRRRSLWTQR